MLIIYSLLIEIAKAKFPSMKDPRGTCWTNGREPMTKKKWAVVNKTMGLLVAGSVAMSATPMGAMASAYEYDSNGRMTGSASSTAKLSRDIAAANETVARLNAAYGQQQVGPQSPGEKAALDVQQQIRSVRIAEKEKSAVQRPLLEPITLSGLMGKLLTQEIKTDSTKESSYSIIKGTLLDNDGQKLSFKGQIQEGFVSPGKLGRSEFNIQYSDGRTINGRVIFSYNKMGLLVGASAEAQIFNPSVRINQKVQFSFDSQKRVTGMYSAFYSDGKCIGYSSVNIVYNRDGSKLTTMKTDFSAISQGRQESTTYTYEAGNSVTKGTSVSTDGKTTTTFTSSTDLNGVTKENSKTTHTRQDGRVEELSTYRNINGTKTEVVTKGIVWEKTKKGLEKVTLVEIGTIVRVGPDKTQSEMTRTTYYANGDKTQTKMSSLNKGIAFLSLVPGIPSLQIPSLRFDFVNGGKRPN